MSITPKQTATKLDINQIYISDSQSALLNNFDPTISNQMLTGQFRIDTSRIEMKIITNEEDDTEQRILRFFVNAGMRYILGELLEKEPIDEEAIKSKIASEIKVTYCAEYKIRGSTELSEEEIKEFGRVNVPYHVWPYWREYAQNTCNRMNLPVSTVPMLIINGKSEKKEDETI